MSRTIAGRLVRAVVLTAGAASCAVPAADPAAEPRQRGVGWVAAGEVGSEQCSSRTSG